MPTAFPQSLRALDAERHSHALVGWLPAVALLGAWVAWFIVARVAVYEVTEMARLEVDRAVYPVAAPLAGRVVATHLVMGREVQAGTVEVEVAWVSLATLVLHAVGKRLGVLPGTPTAGDRSGGTP